jgi:putative Holliday junction resolvase
MPSGDITVINVWPRWTFPNRLLPSLTGQKVFKLGRIIAIDYGRKRTGLAVSDPLRLISNNLKAVPSSEIFDFLDDYFSREKVDIIVVGYPRKLNNQPSESVIYIEPFIKKLGKIFPDKEIVLMDERFTSKIAFNSMIEGNLKKKKRRDKGLIDTISANLILQSFLDYKRNSNG